MLRVKIKSKIQTAVRGRYISEAARQRRVPAVAMQVHSVHKPVQANEEEDSNSCITKRCCNQSVEYQHQLHVGKCAWHACRRG